MFVDRFKAGKPVGMHEFLYPVMVGYDSVMLDVDAELGGSDQEFNMLAGRTLQRALGKREKFIVTTKILEGTDVRVSATASTSPIRRKTCTERFFPQKTL